MKKMFSAIFGSKPKTYQTIGEVDFNKITVNQLNAWDGMKVFANLQGYTITSLIMNDIDTTTLEGKDKYDTVDSIRRKFFDNVCELRPENEIPRIFQEGYANILNSIENTIKDSPNDAVKIWEEYENNMMALYQNREVVYESLLLHVVNTVK